MIIMGKNSVIVILLLGLLLVPALYFNYHSHLVLKGESSRQSGNFEPVVVLELFTSQGCSSCPPADLLLRELVDNSSQALYAVSYHVDYWNYIGWEDPFSKAEYTAMQSTYNDQLHSRSNYTPELIINGKEHMVGSDAAKIKSRIEAAGSERATNSVDLSEVRIDVEGISANYEISGDLQGKRIKAVLLLNERTTYVKRGENGGRALLNSQIALDVRYQMHPNSRGTLTFPIPGLLTSGDTLYLLVMTTNAEHVITGASRIRVPGSG
jgi:hypothetical protein